jgi:hypothetical protein
MSAVFPSAVALGIVAGLSSAIAHPKQIIILRHGEKTETSDLCPTGNLRADALAVQYLGKDAGESLFGADTLRCSTR